MTRDINDTDPRAITRISRRDFPRLYSILYHHIKYHLYFNQYLKNETTIFAKYKENGMRKRMTTYSSITKAIYGKTKNVNLHNLIQLFFKNFPFLGDYVNYTTDKNDSNIIHYMLTEKAISLEEDFEDTTNNRKPAAAKSPSELDTQSIIPPSMKSIIPPITETKDTTPSVTKQKQNTNNTAAELLTHHEVISDTDDLDIDPINIEDDINIGPIDETEEEETAFLAKELGKEVNQDVTYLDKLKNDFINEIKKNQSRKSSQLQNRSSTND